MESAARLKRTGPKRVLIVDDIKEIRERLREFLEEAEFVVWCMSQIRRPVSSKERFGFPVAAPSVLLIRSIVWCDRRLVEGHPRS
jgi:hypothetical protein